MFKIRDCLTNPLINVTPSEIDNLIYIEMRNFINNNILETFKLLNINNKKMRIVDIGLTGHIKSILTNKENIIYETIDIDSTNNPTYVCDITQNNNNIIADGIYDITICTEVLEHTTNPIAAIDELKRITKNNGYIIISTPYNFRIHGPLYDNFRMSEWYYKFVFTNDYTIISMKALELVDRDLSPCDYFLLIHKN
jgi:2-polyprenyl-3-methyl-5-hydroxy-6-metoxy-1,4-benzoquinol methylase